GGGIIGLKKSGCRLSSAAEKTDRLMSSEKIVVCGAGGFIGGHLVADLLRQGKTVRAVDVKPLDEWYQLFPDAENRHLDLREKGACEEAVRDIDVVYNLAADMGGMGFIENNRA